MLRVLAVVCALALLITGCSNINQISDHGMTLRQNIAEGCSFRANVVADFSETTYSFSMNCIADKNRGMEFEVTSPDSIAGICGNISATGGKLTFDDVVLAFPLLANGFDGNLQRKKTEIKPKSAKKETTVKRGRKRSDGSGGQVQWVVPK